MLSVARSADITIKEGSNPTFVEGYLLHVDTIELPSVTDIHATVKDAALGGGCSIPIGAYATVTDDMIQMTGIVAATDGSKIIKVSGENTDCLKLGEELAQAALAQGAAEVLHG